MNAKKWISAFAVIAVLLIFAVGPLGAEEKQVDVNIASVEELSKVPGLNEELASKIVEQREKNGEFVDLEELIDIDGIDSNLLRSLRKHLMIDPASFCGNC